MVERVQAACEVRANALIGCHDATSEGDYAADDDKREAPSKHAPMLIASAPG